MKAKTNQKFEAKSTSRSRRIYPVEKGQEVTINENAELTDVERKYFFSCDVIIDGKKRGLWIPRICLNIIKH